MLKELRLIMVAAVCLAVAVGCSPHTQTKEEFMAGWHDASDEAHSVITSAVGEVIAASFSWDDKSDEETEEEIQAMALKIAKGFQKVQAKYEDLRPPADPPELRRLQAISARMIGDFVFWMRETAGENVDLDARMAESEKLYDPDHTGEVDPLAEMKSILEKLGEESPIVDTYALLAQVEWFDDLPPGYDRAMPVQTDVDRFWDFSDPAATEIKFREALDHAPEDAEDYRAELITQIARTFGLRGKFDEAHELLDQVAEMLPRTNDYVETRYLLERGRAFNSAGEKEKAKALFLQAVETGKLSGDDYLTVDAMHMMGIVEEPEAAIEWQERGLQLVEQSSNPKAKQWTGALTNNLGWTYHDKGDFETALTYFEKGRDYRAEAAKEPGYRIAKWTVARCKRSLGRTEEALQEQRAILDEYYPEFKTGTEVPDMDGYITEEIGECLLALGREEEAKPYFKTAFELLSKDARLVENEPDRIARLKELSS